MNEFSQIKKIQVDQKVSYSGKIFLTFDMDWAHDDILSDTIDLVEAADIDATWYVTHNTPILERLRDNPKFELGIHPNFNFLLNGDSRNGGDPKEIIDRLLEFVPEAKSIRSHSLAQTEILIDLFINRGLKYVSNTYIPFSSKMLIKPWSLWSELVIVPHFFQDNVELRLGNHHMSTENFGLRVFDFHPIHIFLNTESIEHYESSRLVHNQPEKLIKLRGKSHIGIRERFMQLLKIAQ